MGHRRPGSRPPRDRARGRRGTRTADPGPECDGRADRREPPRAAFRAQARTDRVLRSGAAGLMQAAGRPTGAPADVVGAGQGILGIELGSTRIKAALIGPDASPLGAGSHAWESSLVDGVWTYDLDAVWGGVADCYAELSRDVRDGHGLDIESLAGLGISAMMHGYVALDAADELLVPFRTWRNNITARACAELTPVLAFAVPQRWTIAHLFQSILEDQPHVRNIARLTTLGGYVHAKLTGEHVVGIGEASGIFPIDSATGDWDAVRLAAFDALIAPRRLGWNVRDLLPGVLPAGRPAGTLSVEGARRLDQSGRLKSGVRLCPPEGDAGTGMVATNAVRPRTGNVSAGTSVFAMIVLEQSLARIHDGIDIVMTPDGKPVAMAHANNGSSDLDAWLAVLGQAAETLGAEVVVDDLYGKLLSIADTADADAGGLVAINYIAGEHATGFAEGRPLVARSAGSNF